MNLRVLVFAEDGLHYARCLEMDILGTGKTEKQALDTLLEMIHEHISFAVFKNDYSLLMFPSDQADFQRWDKAGKKADPTY